MKTTQLVLMAREGAASPRRRAPFRPCVWAPRSFRERISLDRKSSTVSRSIDSLVEGRDPKDGLGLGLASLARFSDAAAS